MYISLPDSADSRALGFENARIVAASRDGEIAFIPTNHFQSGTLMRAPLSGGAPRAILEDVLAADWTRDGSAFAVARHAPGGAHVEYPVGTVLGEAERPQHLRLSPSGEMLAFSEHPVPNDDRGSVVLIERSGRRSVLSGE